MIKELNGQKVELTIGEYPQNNQLYIKISELYNPVESFYVATVCIDDERLTRQNMKEQCETENEIVIIKDYDENEKIYDWLKEEKIIKEEIMGFVQSGYMAFPLHELTDEFQQYVNQQIGEL